MLIYGMPWNTNVITEFREIVSPSNIKRSENNGIYKVEIVREKTIGIHTYVDTYKIKEALEMLSDQGIAGANADVING